MLLEQREACSPRELFALSRLPFALMPLASERVVARMCGNDPFRLIWLGIRAAEVMPGRCVLRDGAQRNAELASPSRTGHLYALAAFASNSHGIKR